MSRGEQLYLLLVLAAFGGFGLWLAYNSWRFDRTQRTRSARPAESPGDALHA